MSSDQATIPDATRSFRWVDFTIEVSKGPDAGRRFEVTRELPHRLLLGTSEACHFRLTDASVSRRHLSFELIPGGLKVSDEGSTNGTWADRLRIESVVCAGGEWLALGNSVLTIHAGAERKTPLGGARDGFGALLGMSDVMQRLYRLLDRLRDSKLPLLIEGETGTGKEQLAEALHQQSTRAAQPFVVFDCAGVQPSVAEAELFGHEAGAFTGAVGSRAGVFEMAHGGTLLLDEIADLPQELQPKLLRAVERGEVRRVGGAQYKKVDVRVMSATAANLDAEVEAQRFRSDLFHRLTPTRVELPPLRLRHGDVELLARHFWLQLGGSDRTFPDEALERWRDARWPGNVRELKNAVARLKVLGLSEPTQAAAASDSLQGYLDREEPFFAIRDELLRDFETLYVEAALAAHGGDTAKAAAAAGIGQRYFQKLRARGKR